MAQIDIDKQLRKLLSRYKATFDETYSGSISRLLAGPGSTHRPFYRHTAFERDVWLAIAGHDRDVPDADPDADTGGVPIDAIQAALQERYGQVPDAGVVENACLALAEDDLLVELTDSWATTTTAIKAVTGHLEWVGQQLEGLPTSNGERVVVERRQVGRTLDEFPDSEAESPVTGGGD